MTTEIDLLPMPKPEGSGLYRAWSYDQMRDYARANVARAVAPLQAEIDALRTRLEDTVRDSTDKIKALRAEVAEAREFRDKLAKAIGNEQLRMFIEKHGEPVPLTIRMQEAEARAERLEAEVERVTCELMDATTRADKLEKMLRAYQAAVNKIDDLIEYSLPMPPETKAALYAILDDLTAAL